MNGLMRATVVDTADPDGRQRLRISIPEFGPQPLATWALACLPASALTVPHVGDTVWVAFEKGDPDAPVWLGICPVVHT
jgi:uncharacterized protein involved in type VI secretion and phage assembly